jgi:hypothetical protein
VCARVDRAINGQAAGAVAVIMVNNAAGLPPFDGEVDGLTIPFLGVGDEHAGDLKSRNGQSATITDNGTVASPQFGVLASFTSSGPRTGDSAMKPDVTAPGVSVKSVAMGTGTQGTYISGTSMATPHTSGVAALVIAGHPTWTPTQVRAAIMNNANPDLITDPSVLLAGGGAADALDAIDSKILAMTENQGASLSFGYQVLTGAFSATKTVTLSNFSGSPVHVDASLDVQDGLDYSIAVSPTAVTVPAASSGQPGQATMNVTISLTQAQAASLPFAEDAAPSGETDITIRSARGGVTLTPATGPVLRVPYLLVPRAASDIVAQPVTVAATNTAPVSQNVSIENRGIHDGAAEVLAWTNTDPADTSGQAVDIRGVGVEVLPGNFLGLQNKDKSLLFAVNSWNQWSTANGEAEFDIGIDTKGGPAPDYFVFGYDLGQLLFDAFDGTYASFVVTAQGELIDVWLADAPINGSTILLPAAASDLGLTKGGANQLRITDVAGFSLQDGSVFDPVAIAKNHRPTIHPWSSPLDQGFGYSIPAGGSDSAALKFKNSAKTDNLLGWMFVTMDDRNGPAQADVIKFPK